MNENIGIHLNKINTAQHPKKILDVGCGTRPYEALFFGAQYTGLDVYQSGRKAQDKIADIYFDGINIPLADNSFDMVLCTQVLEHCLEPDSLLKEMCRVLEPGGVLVLTLPFVWLEHERPYDFRRFSYFGAEQIAKKFELEAESISRLTCGKEALIALIDSIGRRSINGKFDHFIFRLCMKNVRVCLKYLTRKLNPELFYLNTIAVLRKKV